VGTKLCQRGIREGGGGGGREGRKDLVVGWGATRKTRYRAKRKELGGKKRTGLPAGVQFPRSVGGEFEKENPTMGGTREERGKAANRPLKTVKASRSTRREGIKFQKRKGMHVKQVRTIGEKSKNMSNSCRKKRHLTGSLFTALRKQGKDRLRRCEGHGGVAKLKEKKPLAGP